MTKTYRVTAEAPFVYAQHDNFWVEETVVSAQYWYDRYLKLWTVYREDANGYQIGAAQYAAGKPEAEYVAKRMASR